VTIAVVQHASATAAFTSGTTGTVAPAFTSNVTAGNCLVAIFSVNGATATPTVTSVTTNGTAENWVLAKADADGFIFFYVDANSGGGQKIIDVNLAFGFTATTSNSACVTADIYEVSGLGTTVTVDKTATADQDTTAGTSWSSGATLTTTQANEIWFGNVAVSPSATNTTSTITPSGAWTNETTISSSIQAGGTSTSDKFETFQRSGFQVVSSTGTATYSGTCSASSFWNAGAIALSGTSSVTGTAAVAEAPLTVSAAGTVAATGTGAVAEAPLTVSAAGNVAVAGSAAVVLAPLTVSAAGSSTIPGVAAVILAPLKVSAAGATLVTGTAAVALASLTVAASGSMTPRKLLVSLASMAGTDDYGNTFPKGIQVGSAADGPQVQLLPNVNGSSQLSFPIPGEPTTPPNVAAGWNGSAGVLELSGSQSTAPGYDDWVQILMFSNSNGGGGASVQFILVNSSGVPQLIGSYSALGWNLNGQVNITGSLFVNGTPIT
jgi:hypothetical protein